MFEGIEPENRPPVIWIQHKDKNRLELNYTTFNSLMNKKHFQCYYHLSDKKLFNSFFNSKTSIFCLVNELLVSTAAFRDNEKTITIKTLFINFFL